MRCYNCGFELSENDFCTACGADVKIYKRIIYLSNTFYNEGLQKARVRDLQGSAQCLRLSLKCNKYNTEARNLLGLVLFEVGDAVNAISEWVISKSFQPQKNIADGFMDAIQNNPSKWDNIRQTIIKYNKALEYSRQNSLDMAVIQLKGLLKMNPHMVNAYQLLALLYIQGEEWEKASRCVARASRIDANNTTLQLYQKEIEAALYGADDQDGDASSRRRRKKNQRNVIEYTSGNETIIQPINHPEKNAAMTTVVNILIGMLIGFAILWFLVLPARVKSAQDEINESMRENSSQLEEKNARADELQKKIKALEEEKQDLTERLEGYTGSSGVMGNINILMRAAKDYMDGGVDSSDIASRILSIDYDFATGDEAGEDFRELYSFMRSQVCEKASKEYMEKGIEDIREEDYTSAIEALTKAVELNDRNDEALYNLGRAYDRSEQGDMAKRIYVRLLELFPDSEFAPSVREYVTEDDIAAYSTPEEASQEEQQPEEIQEAPVEEETGAEGGEGGEAIVITPLNSSEEEGQVGAGAENAL